MPFPILTRRRRWHAISEARWRWRWSWPRTPPMCRWGRHGWWTAASHSMGPVATSWSLWSMRVEVVAGWWPCLLRFWLRHGPHVHRDSPIWLNHGLPDLGENDLSIWTDQIIVTLVNVWTDDINVQECLFDELFHSLR